MPNEFEPDPFGGPAAGDITFDTPVIPDDEKSFSEYAVPAGRWPSTVLDIEKGKSKKLNPETNELYDKIVISFSISADGRAYKLRLYMTLTPAAAWKGSETFVALGFEGRKNIPRSEIIGSKCMCVIHRGPDDYANGEIRSKITKCEPMEVTGPGALSTDPSDQLPF